MNILKYKLALLLCCLCFASVRAQDAGKQELKAVVARIKELRTYSYETLSKGSFPGGKQQERLSHVYMDGPGKKLCYSNEQILLLLTPKWAYKVDHYNKHVSIFDVNRYNKKNGEALPELESVFRSNLTATFLDSVLLPVGKLISAKKKGSLTTFTVKFPAGYAVEEMVIVYNYASQLPESVTSKSFYPGDQKNTRNKGTEIVMISRKYSLEVPAAVFNTDQYFSVRNGKPILARYKNYKVSSIL